MRLKPENLVTRPFIIILSSFILKTLMVFVVVYICVGYLLAGLSTRDFSYRKNKPLELHASILMQPVMDLFAYSKVSNWYDFSKIDSNKIPENIVGLNIQGDSNIRKLQEKLVWTNTNASLGGIKTAVIVEPSDFSGKWSLVFCIKNQDFCEESNILAKGKIKLISDGEQQIWGKTEKGDFIQLRLVKYIQRDQFMDILHI